MYVGKDCWDFKRFRKNVSCNDKMNYNINVYMRIKNLLKWYSINGMGTTPHLKSIVVFAFTPEILIRS